MRLASPDLSRRSVWMLATIIPLGLAHHLDHVLRVDHSGWPFRSDVTPFTYSLLAYPVVLFALLGPSRLAGWRWAGLFLGALLTVFAHTLLETPAMQYASWALGQSIDPHSPGLPNMLCIQSRALGVGAVALAAALNLALVAATVSFAWDVIRRRRPGS